MRISIFIFVLVFLLSSVNIAPAQQSNIMISPPPIPWFEWQSGQNDLRAGGLYFTSSGDEFSMKGLGGNMVWRTPFNELFAMDLGGSFLNISGEVPDYGLDMSFIGYTLPGDIELQMVNNKDISLIAFLGYSFNFVSGEVITPEGDASASASTSGPQFGAQLSLKLDQFTISPFFLIQKQSGSTKVYFDEDTIKQDISFTSKSFGFDIVLVQHNITLSSILQQMPGSSGSDDYTTYIFCLNYDFQWIDPNAVTAASSDAVNSDTVKNKKTDAKIDKKSEKKTEKKPGKKDDQQDGFGL